MNKIMNAKIDSFTEAEWNNILWQMVAEAVKKTGKEPGTMNSIGICVLLKRRFSIHKLTSAVYSHLLQGETSVVRLKEANGN
jgi:hypothetical protein